LSEQLVILAELIETNNDATLKKLGSSVLTAAQMLVKSS
jgi:hypothetical protein